MKRYFFNKKNYIIMILFITIIYVYNYTYFVSLSDFIVIPLISLFSYIIFTIYLYYKKLIIKILLFLIGISGPVLLNLLLNQFFNIEIPSVVIKVSWHCGLSFKLMAIVLFDMKMKNSLYSE